MARCPPPLGYGDGFGGPHCRLRLCYEHALPEEHGCGQAARGAARSAHVAAAAAAAGGRGSGGKRSSDAWKHDALARQLHKRLDEAADKRGPKKKDSKAA